MSSDMRDLDRLRSKLLWDMMGKQQDESVKIIPKIRREARMAFQSENYLEAAKLYNQLIELAPTEVDSHLRLARCYQAAGKDDFAVEALKRAAMMYAEHNFPSQAIAVLRMYKDIHPNDYQVPLEIFRKYRDMFEEDNKALELLPNQYVWGYRIKDHEFFAGMSDDIFDRFLDGCKVRNIKKGDALMKMGDIAESLFIVIEGCLEASMIIRGKIKILGDVEAGGLCGEIAYFTGAKRTAHMVAMQDTSVLEIPYDLLDALGDEAGSLYEHMESLYKLRILEKQLSLAPVFSLLKPDERSYIAMNMHKEKLSAGQPLFFENERGGDIYVVRSGKLSVNINVKGEEQQMSVVETGGVVGEIAVLNKLTRTATVRAITDVLLMKLDVKLYKKMLDNNKNILKFVHQNRKEQFAATRAFIRKPIDIEGDDECEDLLRHIWSI